MEQTLITNPSEIQLNDRQTFDAMLGNPPTWLMRFGIVAVSGFVCVLFLAASIIKYPDIIQAKVLLTTENPPIRLFPKINGRVQYLAVQQGQYVEKGTVIAVLENTAYWRDVLLLEEKLRTATPINQLPESLNMGTLQGVYASFLQQIKDYGYFSIHSGLPTKIQQIETQILQLQRLNSNLEKQKELQKQSFRLVETDFQRQKHLHTEGVISQVELEKITSSFLEQKRQIEVLESQFISNEMQIQQFYAQINDLKQNNSDNSSQKNLALQEAQQKIMSEIDIWKQTYLIIAPTEGHISLSKVWSIEQSVSTSEEFVSIVQKNAAHIIAKATVPVAGSGKLEKGLVANIHLADFPMRQYGTIKGTIKDIGAVPQKEEYNISIALPDTLYTNYQKTIPYRPEMLGTAKIITEDRFLISRILDGFRTLIE